MPKYACRLALQVLFILSTSNSWATAPIDSDAAISDSHSIQAKPTLAYDPNHDRYLATWSDHRNQVMDVDIYGRLLNSRGKPIGNEIPIAVHKGGQGMSAVSFDNKNNRYLVIWVDWRNAANVDSDIYGQFVNADGSLYGNNFVISKHRVSQKQPAVAYDPARQRYLVVWKDFRGGEFERLYGRYLNAKGKAIGNEFRIAKGAGKQDRPSLYYDTRRKRFLVVWRDIVDKKQYLNSMIAGYGLFAAFVDPLLPVKQGGQLKEGMLIDTDEDASQPASLYSAAYSPEKDVFLVAWTSGRQHRQQGFDVYAALLRPSDGKRIGKSFPVAVQNEYQEFPAVVYDARRQRFLVVWYDLRRGSGLNMDVFGRYVTAKGEMMEEFLISDAHGRGSRRYPAMAISPKNDSVFILWEDNREKTSTKHRQRIFSRVRSLN